MKFYKLSQLATVTKGKLYGNDIDFNNVFIDSRKLATYSSLFFAIKGKRHDGHQYLFDLYKQGIRAFIVNNLPNNYNDYTDAGFVVVKDTLLALQEFAAYHLKQFNCTVIGITGSNGKTIVKEWIAQLLQNDSKLVRSPKSYNSQVGVPLSLLLVDEYDELAIFEIGISQKNEMEKLEKIVHPQIGIFTNIGDAHQENFKDIYEKVDEKLKLFIQSKTLIYCGDSSIINDRVKLLLKNIECFTWGYNESANLKIEKIDHSYNKTYLQLKYANCTFNILVPYTDSASIENIMHCVSLLLILGYDFQFISERIALLLPIAMRMELKEGVNNCTVINDSYNSDINSLTIALDFLSGSTLNPNKTLILSDILQSGKSNDILYKEVAKLIHDKKINRFIGIGTQLSNYASIFEVPKKEFFIDTDEFLRKFKRDTFYNESILLKGSRNFKFERVSRLLEKKIHETVLEVNLNALTNNLNYFRSLLKPTTKIMAMVKAFSYGTGSYEIASLLQYHRVDYLAVAFADEGVVLREAGINLPIVVLNAEPGSFNTMIEYDLEPEIYSINSLTYFCNLAQREGMSDYPIHIKFDTGMHRLGFLEDEMDALVNILRQNKQVKVSSVFTHLAASDEMLHDNFTLQQIKLFESLTNKIKKDIGYSFIRHVLNSSGIERFPDAQFDMVRLGIGLYGVSSVNNILEVTSVLRSTIVQIKKVSKEETVGYNRVGQVKQNKQIAIIPIGYADGLNRKFSDGVGYILVNGKPASIIGNICMDTCMIDITGIDAKEGDQVIIFGQKPTIKEMAQKINTIPYEILTSVSQRVKRIYISD